MPNRFDRNRTCNHYVEINIFFLSLCSLCSLYMIILAYKFWIAYREDKKHGNLLSRRMGMLSWVIIVMSIIPQISSTIQSILCLTNMISGALITSLITGLSYIASIYCLLLVFIFRLHEVFKDTQYRYSKSKLQVMLTVIIFSFSIAISGWFLAPIEFEYTLIASAITMAIYLMLSCVTLWLFIYGLFRVSINSRSRTSLSRMTSRTTTMNIVHVSSGGAGGACGSGSGGGINSGGKAKAKKSSTSSIKSVKKSTGIDSVMSDKMLIEMTRGQSKIIETMSKYCILVSCSILIGAVGFILIFLRIIQYLVREDDNTTNVYGVEYNTTALYVQKLWLIFGCTINLTCFLTQFRFFGKNTYDKICYRLDLKCQSLFRIYSINSIMNKQEKESQIYTNNNTGKLGDVTSASLSPMSSSPMASPMNLAVSGMSSSQSQLQLSSLPPVVETGIDSDGTVNN